MIWTHDLPPSVLTHCHQMVAVIYLVVFHITSPVVIFPPTSLTSPPSSSYQQLCLILCLALPSFMVYLVVSIDTIEYLCG
jgi:hypothetical protein